MTFADEVVAQVPNLRRYAHRLAGNDADDLLQDTVLRALRKQHLFDGRDLRAWLFTMMHNYNASCVKQSARFAKVMVDEEMASYTNADAGVLVREVVAEVERLPGEQRRLIIDVVSGMSYAEAARREGVPVGTARSRISRGRDKLREFAR